MGPYSTGSCWCRSLNRLQESVNSEFSRLMFSRQSPSVEVWRAVFLLPGCERTKTYPGKQEIAFTRLILDIPALSPSSVEASFSLSVRVYDPTLSGIKPVVSVIIHPRETRGCDLNVSLIVLAFPCRQSARTADLKTPLWRHFCFGT